MCGINGFTGHDPSLLRRMHAATRHRGPDDEGFFESPACSLAHNRLSIIDLSPGGRQPMTSQNQRFTIVFNGEIYNYKEVKAELTALGASFRSASDTEVLLAAWTQWGKDCLPKLNGIFAFAMWDRNAETLTLVRDPFGVKPLYYAEQNGQMAFSSEIKALLEWTSTRTLDHAAMNQYFRLLYVPAPRTMFQEVKKLPAGHLATWKQGSLTVSRYDHITEGTPIASYAEAVEGVRAHLKEAVRRQRVSDRPLGVFLSGGMDSSAIVGLMRELDPSGTLKTFTVGYETDVDAEKYNADAVLAAKTAQHFNTEHHAFRMTAAQTADLLEKVAFHMDEPIANHVQPSTLFLASHAKPHITVALGGDGGDELFGGYPRYWYAKWMENFQKFPGIVFALKKGNEDARRLALPHSVDRHLTFVAQKEAMLDFLKTSDATTVREPFTPLYAQSWRDRINQMMAIDLQTWLPDESLMRTDKMTMASGLEERVPLLDPDLVSYAQRIPSAWKIDHKNQGKRIFRDAVKHTLPLHTLAAPKRAWMSPMAKWIRGPLEPTVRAILSPSFVEGTSNLIDFAAVERMLNRHIAKEAYALPELWSLVMFQLWWKQFHPSA